MNSNNLFDSLYNLYHEQKMAHAYLFETNDVELCYENVKILSKKLFCEQEFKKGCTNCNICTLIDKNNLPNFIVIEPDGKSIKKGQIDELKRVCSTIPLFVNKHIYIIKYAEKMNDTTYNKMLKFLEEPEDNIIGFYITENKDNIPSTILSRLEVVKSYYEKDPVDLLGDELKEAADNYISKLENHDSDILWYNETVLASMLKDRVKITNFFKYLFDYYYENTNKVSNIKNIKKKIDLITKYLNTLDNNVNGQLALNSFSIEMGDL